MVDFFDVDMHENCFRCYICYMLNTILHLIFLFGVPLVMYFLCARIKVLDWMGPVVLCWLAGIFAVNAGVTFVDPVLNETIMGVAVPLAIILLLFSSDFSVWKKLVGGAGFSFLLVLISVCLATVMGYSLLKSDLPDAAPVGGLLIGVYTGATANMAAVAAMLGREDLFGVVNMYEVLCGGVYLTFVMTVAQRFYGLFLPEKKALYDFGEDYKDPSQQEVKPLGVLASVGLALVVLGIGVGLSMLFFSGTNAAFIIGVITILAVSASFLPKVKQLKGSYAAGDYCLLVFGTAAGLLADFRNFNNDAIAIGIMTALVLALSLALHIFFSWIFKIDRDTAIITAAAGIMSAPFVPAIARSMKNTSIIVPGIASGILGTAAGSLLGYWTTRLLENL